MDQDGVINILQRCIRVGVVSQIDINNHTVRVDFEEDGATSYDLPVLALNTRLNKDYNLPDIGEDVLCLFLPGGQENGFVIGSFFAGEVTPPITNSNVRMVKFSDDTKVKYNRESHDLDIEIEGTHIHADREKVNVTTVQEVNINTINANITTSGNITMQSGGDTSITAGGTISIQGATVNIN